MKSSGNRFEFLLTEGLGFLFEPRKVRPDQSPTLLSIPSFRKSLYEFFQVAYFLIGF
jgi:hypothetical protein